MKQSEELIRFLGSITNNRLSANGCNLYRLTDDFKNLRRTYPDSVLIEIFTRVPEELFNDALYLSSKDTCKHLKPHCPVEKNAETIRRFAINKVLEGLPVKQSWEECLQLYHHMNTEGKLIMCDRILTLQKSLFLTSDRSKYHTKTAVESVRNYTSNPVNLTFVRVMLDDPQRSKDIFDFYRDCNGGDAYCITDFLNNYYTVMRQLFDKEGWNKECISMLALVASALDSLPAYLDAKNLTAALNQFISYAEPDGVNVLTQAKHYSNFICRSGLSTEEGNKMLDAMISSLEADDKKGLMSTLFDKLFSIFTPGKADSRPEKVNPVLMRMVEHINTNISEQVDEVVLRRCRGGQSNQIEQILKALHLKQNPVLKQCHDRLQSRVNNFCERVFKGDLRYLVFKQLNSDSMMNKLWDFIHPMDKNRPEHWNLNNLKKSFRSMNETCEQLDKSKATIENILSDKPFFDQLDTRELAEALRTLKEEKTLTVDTIRDVGKQMSNLKFLTRSLELRSFPLYRSTVAQALASMDERRKLSKEDFNSVCEESEGVVRETLINWIGLIDHESFQQLKSNRAWINGDQSTNLVRLEILDEDGLASFKLILDMAEVVVHVSSVTESLDKLASFFTSKGKLLDTEVHEKFQDKLQKASELFASTGVNLAEIDWDYKERILLGIIASNSNSVLFETVSNCIDLMSHFCLLPSRHFQDLYLDRNAIYKIEDEDIALVQELRDVFQAEDKFNSLVDILELFATPKFKHLSRLTNMSEQLIEASNDLLRDKSDKIENVRRILSNSTVRYRLKKSEFEVLCIHDTDPKAAAENPKDPDGSLDMNALTDIKIKLSMLKEADLKGNKAKIMKMIDAFLPMIECIEQIAELLNSIMKSGQVYRLGQALGDYITNNESRLNCSAEQVNSLWCEHNQTLAILITPAKDKSAFMREAVAEFPVVDAQHFTVVKEALQLLQRDIEDSMLNFRNSNHNLLIFDATQKLALCNYLDRFAGGVKVDEKETQRS